MKKIVNVLYLSSNENDLLSFKATFRLKYHVFVATNKAGAISLLENNTIHVVIVEQKMADMSGVEFLENILDNFPDPIRILITGYSDMNTVVDAINKGKIFHYLTKPVNEEELEKTIERAFYIYGEKEKIKELNEELEFQNDKLEFLLPPKSRSSNNINFIFDTREFDSEEVVEIIQLFSELYRSIGGDELEIKKADLLHLVGNLQTELI